MAELVNDSDLCPPSPDECSVLVQKVKLLEERMDRKASELMNEINKLTANDRLNTVLSQEYIDNILRENAKLKSENESLRERAENLSYIISDLNTRVKDLETEKASLVTVFKILQSDADQYGNNCTSAKRETAVKEPIRIHNGCDLVFVSCSEAIIDKKRLKQKSLKPKSN